MCGKNCFVRCGKDCNSVLAALMIVSRIFTSQGHFALSFPALSRSKKKTGTSGLPGQPESPCHHYHVIKHVLMKMKSHDSSPAEGKMGILAHNESSFKSAAPSQCSYPDQLEVACFVIFQMK